VSRRSRTARRAPALSSSARERDRTAREAGRTPPRSASRRRGAGFLDYLIVAALVTLALMIAFGAFLLLHGSL